MLRLGRAAHRAAQAPGVEAARGRKPTPQARGPQGVAAGGVMIGRLANVIYWVYCLAAAIIALLAIFITLEGAGPMVGIFYFGIPPSAFFCSALRRDTS
jgi:hypothetical protein